MSDWLGRLVHCPPPPTSVLSVLVFALYSPVLSLYHNALLNLIHRLRLSSLASILHYLPLMANPRKRKETPQASTLHNFFGKGTHRRSSQDHKKFKSEAEGISNRVSARRIDCKARGEVIVIDSDEDDVVEITPVRPVPKPIQPKSRNSGSATTSSAYNRTCEVAHSADLSTPRPYLRIYWTLIASQALV